MNTIVIAIPRFALSGGNLVSLEIAKFLEKKGYLVYIHSGFKKEKIHNVELIRYKRGLLNTFLNLLSFINLSCYGLFDNNYIATHHLTSLFNFIKPVKFALVQDDESKFYPEKLKLVGCLLWNNYLKARTLIFTNKYLAFKIKPDFKNITGFAYIESMDSRVVSKRPADDKECSKAMMILRDGKYKGFKQTFELFEYLNDNNIPTLLINQSRNKIVTRHLHMVREGLPRNEFMELMNKVDYFICLSEWEGLGLPNFEAFSLGVKIISTEIPSALIINEVSPESISFETEFLRIKEIIETGSLSNNGLQASFLQNENYAWLEYVYRLIDTELNYAG
ncbi:glycosyltransferase [Lelliottia amnigena]|uniref:Glycosyltransferase n=1 Tax=Lelliottia amnigena TaxID=61646 RepID=A0ABU7UCB2_LELAM